MKPVVLIVAVVLCLILAAAFLFKGGEKRITNAPPKNETIVAFGDSLVEGVGSKRGGGFVSILTDRTGKEIVNLGAAGETTKQGKARIDEVLSYEPGTVLLLFGGNDALKKVPQDETMRNLAFIIERLHKDGVVVVLLGIRGGILGDPYDEMYEELSSTYDTAYVPNVLRGIMLKPELTADQLHPNDEGYAVIATRIAPVLLDVLNSNPDV